MLSRVSAWGMACVAVLFSLGGPQEAGAQELYVFPEEVQTRWLSFENPDAAKGQGGKENQGAKGHAFETLDPGESATLADQSGVSGVIRRMWITVSERSPTMLRALRIQMYWDGAKKTAVDVPLGDFFGVGLGRITAFENALFSTAEGRSFTSYVTMPFRERARIVVTNEGDRRTDLFYTINYTAEDVSDEALYFHAHWRRDRATELGQDFELLPRIEGRGRYLGAAIGVMTNPQYETSWWGEGEVKVYLDGDEAYPTLVGTGTEDYIGTGWGQGVFVNRYQGCTIADPEGHLWAFYRYHVPDPVYFHEDIRVTLQQIGGWPREKVAQLQKSGAKLQPVTIDTGGRENLIEFLEQDAEPDITASDFPGGWLNFYRSDDVSTTTYFYLDKPASSLPVLAPVRQRTAGIEENP